MGRKNAGERGVVFSYTSGKNLLDKTMCIFSWIGQNLVIVGVFMHETWDWVNLNSGVIQTIIAVIALVLAILGYFKVVYQIKMAKDQADEALKQNGFEIKIQMLNLSISVIEANHAELINKNEILMLLKQVGEDNELDESEKEVLDELIEQFENKIESNKEVAQMLISMSDAINKYPNFNFDRDHKNIYMLYEALISTIRSSNNHDVAKYLFEYKNPKD